MRKGKGLWTPTSSLCPEVNHSCTNTRAHTKGHVTLVTTGVTLLGSSCAGDRCHHIDGIGVSCAYLCSRSRNTSSTRPCVFFVRLDPLSGVAALSFRWSPTESRMPTDQDSLKRERSICVLARCVCQFSWGMSQNSEHYTK